MIPNITRGRSFKGLEAYLSHDKRQANGTNASADRVGFTAMSGFLDGEARTTTEAARVMAATWKHADQLKTAAGIKNGGRKAEAPPVWHCSLSWHPTEKPSAQEMKDAAKEALKVAGLGLDRGFQTVIVEHTDEPHAHVHLFVNLVHPITGRQANPYDDQRKLQKWADRYDLKRGNVFAKDRRAKQQAIQDKAPIPPRTTDNPRNRAEWHFRRATSTGRYSASRAEATSIRSRYEEQAARIQQESRDEYTTRRARAAQLETEYQRRREEIKSQYKDRLDAITKRRRPAPGMAPKIPLTPQQYRDWRDTTEWKQLSKKLHQQRRAFNEREKTYAGRLVNAFLLAAKSSQAKGPRSLAAFFSMMANKDARTIFHQVYEQTAKQALSDKQYLRRQARANPVRAAMNAELAALSFEYKKQRSALRSEADAGKAKRQAAWRELSEQRTRDWADWRNRYDVRERDRPGEQAPGRPVEPQRQTAASPPPVARQSPKRPTPSRITPLFDRLLHKRGTAAGKEQPAREAAAPAATPQQAEPVRSTTQNATPGRTTQDSAAQSRDQASQKRRDDFRTAADDLAADPTEAKKTATGRKTADEKTADRQAAREDRIQGGWTKRSKERKPRDRSTGGGRERSRDRDNEP